MDKPNHIKEINLDYIISYVKEQGNWAILWLKELINKPMPPNKNGKERKITFIEIRQEFVKKFIPELLPIPKDKKPSMFEIINNL